MLTSIMRFHSSTWPCSSPDALEIGDVERVRVGGAASVAQLLRECLETMGAPDADDRVWPAAPRTRAMPAPMPLLAR
jgi:hypothetical protein